MASVEFGPLLRERIRKQHAFEREKRESYGLVQGSYDMDCLVRNYLPQCRAGEHLLGGREVFFADYLQALLDQHKGGPPVVAMDIGGGIGLTWLRLAGVFRPEIESGELVLGVTNLDDVSRYTILRNHLDEAELEATQALLAKNGSLVNYLTTTFSLLHKQTVSLPDGSHLPLAGNTSLVHEERSLTLWTQLPEIHLHRIGQIMADDGLFITRDPTGNRGRYDETEHNLPNAKWRGVDLAQRALESTFGLTPHMRVQSGAMTGLLLQPLLYTAPNAPLIHVD